jgi:4-amino-4-deoxy-L-arabinose transferase-like glycosyltransferase
MLKKILAGLILTAAVLFLFFFHAGQIPLWSSDEGRFGQIALEMWESKNFTIPTFNGIVYLDKPVLAPLLTSFAYGLFGVHALSARLFPILAGIFGILTTFLFTRKLFNLRTAAYTAVVLATTFGYVLVGRFAVIDMIMAFLLTACLFSLMTAYLSRQMKYYLLAYAFMGLAFLAKGLIGIVLPGLIFLAFLIWRKDFGEIKKMRLGWGFLIVSALIFPWVISAAIQKSDFLDIFFAEQQFGRFLTGSFGRRRPFWFFVPILFATAFPWSFFLPSAAVNGLKKENPFRPAVQFLFCWIAVTFIFFSIPKSKLPYYLLPLSPAAAVLVGGLLSNWGERFGPSARERKVLGIILKLLTAVFSIAAFAGTIVFLFWRGLEESGPLQPIIHLTALVLILGGLALYLSTRWKNHERALFPLAGTVYGVLVLTIVGMGIITPYQSTHAYAKFLGPRLQAGDRIAVFGSPDRFSDLPFHLRRRIIIAGSDRGTLRDQAALLSREERDPWFMDVGNFGRLFSDPSEQVFCLLEKDDLEELKRETGIKTFQILKEEGRTLLISNTQ